jgi:hypothetical protein
MIHGYNVCQSLNIFLVGPAIKNDYKYNDRLLFEYGDLIKAAPVPTSMPSK